MRVASHPRAVPPWSPWELDLLKRMYGVVPYAEILPRLSGRSYNSVRGKAAKLGIQRKRRTWTGKDISKLRRVFPTATMAELQEAFPHSTLSNIRAIAYDHRIYRRLAIPKKTGILVLDELRQRATEAGFSMTVLDRISKSRTDYFHRAGWVNGFIDYKAIDTGIEALGGKMVIRWMD